MSGKAQQQSRIKELITLGREQKYLTYAEVNDHLPEDISDPEQVEDIIRMINDMGIPVHESAPDADALMLADADTDEAAAEEAAAALAAVESDIGRTTDPVRMYMREMGTVELLTREGEIEIAKRIEEGIREVMGAIAHFPGTVEYILSEYDRVTSEGGRLSDVLSGYIDPDDGIAPPAEVPPPMDEKATKADDKDDDEDEESEGSDEEEETESGPDPVVAQQRFGAVADQLAITLKALKKGREDKQAVAEMLALADLFMPIKLVPKQFEVLVERVRGALERLRAQERAIMQLCVRDARMPRAEFLRSFPGNEVDLSWSDSIASSKSKHGEAIVRFQPDIKRCQQKLRDLEEETGLTVAEIKDINRRMSIGEAKARRAKKEMVEANLRLVISIAKKYTNR
ncbi:RNA polymerase sigma factor region1.1 domain-containing protein, partial [uncultured Pseudomonas sp.]